MRWTAESACRTRLSRFGRVRHHRQPLSRSRASSGFAALSPGKVPAETVLSPHSGLVSNSDSNAGGYLLDSGASRQSNRHPLGDGRVVVGSEPGQRRYRSKCCWAPHSCNGTPRSAAGGVRQCPDRGQPMCRARRHAFASPPERAGAGSSAGSVLAGSAWWASGSGADDHPTKRTGAILMMCRCSGRA